MIEELSIKEEWILGTCHICKYPIIKLDVSTDLPSDIEFDLQLFLSDEKGWYHELCLEDPKHFNNIIFPISNTS